MANQSINLLNQAASFIITRDLQNSENVDNYDRSDVNSIITGLWSKLKHSPQDFSLTYIMSNIEKSFAMEQQKKRRGITFSPEQLEDLITNNVNILFKELAEKFQAKQIFGNHIPVDISSYEHLQRVLEDEALQTIWDSNLAERFVFNGPAPTSLSEIKAWLNHPANATQLNGIQMLDLSGLELRAIPPEISALTRLRQLNLSNNQISSIPDSLSKLSRLKKLDLGGNEISSIPDSLSKLSRLKKLDLAENQIIIIPDSLSKLSQLQKLYLDDNQISSIPDSLGSLPQLQELYLENNQISSIPDSLGSLSQLNCLDFQGNQISSIPDSLSNLSQLRTLYLQNNQISSMPDASKLSQVEHLNFGANPLLFTYDRSPTSCHILKLVALYSEFKEYKCLSSFSNLYQLMVQKNDNHQMIKEAFGNLKKNDQNLIFEMVYKVSGIHSNEDPIFWGEHHVFDNMNIFYHAVKKAIAVKFDRLSLKEKNTVYKEIYQLARSETEDLKWGEHHAFDDDRRLRIAMNGIGAFDHVLRLIDAMDKSEFVSDVQEFDKSLQALLSELFH
jgi:Leucine-rich repeat (LRR) protein